MKPSKPEFAEPEDADARRQIRPVICYSPDELERPDAQRIRSERAGAKKTNELTVAPRNAGCLEVPAGAYFRISSVEGSQVGDLNLWNAKDISERFFSGKTRALHGTHLSTGDRLWSILPFLRPMATIVADTLDWYGFDDFGGSVHDVIGTRCDPYTGRLLGGSDYHYCCHSNLTRAFAAHTGLKLEEAELHVHDVLNVFMCTGFTRDTGQYFMKASPARPGDYIEFKAEIDLIVGLSACPGGDCGSEHTSDNAQCHPLLVEVFDPGDAIRNRHVEPEVSGYDRSHGVTQPG